ncbi:MAG: hypothetical protein V3U54_12870 [Thermodesulfobacteriota bacterium]
MSTIYNIEKIEAKLKEFGIKVDLKGQFVYIKIPLGTLGFMGPHNEFTEETPYITLSFELQEGHAFTSHFAFHQLDLPKTLKGFKRRPTKQKTVIEQGGIPRGYGSSKSPE